MFVFPYLIEIGVFVIAIFRHINAKTPFNCHLWPCIIQFQIWSLLILFFFKSSLMEDISHPFRTAQFKFAVIQAHMLKKKKPDPNRFYEKRLECSETHNKYIKHFSIFRRGLVLRNSYFDV